MMRLIALAALFIPMVCAEQDLIDWLPDYHQALALAKAEKKPLFVEFRCEA